MAEGYNQSRGSDFNDPQGETKQSGTSSHPNDSESSLGEIDGDYGSYRNHVFANPKLAAYWRNVYENARYEGRHRFDPDFTWSASEEKSLKRKVRSGCESRNKHANLKPRSTFESWLGHG